MPKTMRIEIDRVGGAEDMIAREVDLPPPGAGEATIRHRAVGLNFIDVYHRTGLYPLPLPSGLGLEAAGVVEACGDGVETRFGLRVGDRVAYGSGPIGAYAQARTMPASRLIKLPDSIADDAAAAMILKGMTARFLLRKTWPLKAGETILFHAAAGGVGLIACQWAKSLGAKVIGVVGDEKKARAAADHGCDVVVNGRKEDIAARVRDVTGGVGVDVVYDSVGKDTLQASLNSLRRRGLLVSFGNASGPTGPIDPLLLSQKGSLFLTRPTLMDHIAEDDDFRETADDLMAMATSGRIRFPAPRRYALTEAAQAHRDLEARRTTGASVLIP